MNSSERKGGAAASRRTARSLLRRSLGQHVAVFAAHHLQLDGRVALVGEGGLVIPGAPFDDGHVAQAQLLAVGGGDQRQVGEGPFVTALTRVPATGALMLAGGLAVLMIPVAVHFVTLPVEFDASFRRALPILALGYVPRDELPAARRILTACALTYVAASLAALLNFWRWIYFLRR